MAISASVDDYLKQNAIEFDLVAHEPTGSTQESADAAHVPDDQIAKGVMVRDGQGDALVVLPGNVWLVLDRLNKASGRAFELDEESELTGLFPDCQPGAVPPLGRAFGLETYLDEALTTLANVYFEAGDHQHLVRVDGSDFVRLMHGVHIGHFGRQA